MMASTIGVCILALVQITTAPRPETGNRTSEPIISGPCDAPDWAYTETLKMECLEGRWTPVQCILTTYMDHFVGVFGKPAYFHKRPYGYLAFRNFQDLAGSESRLGFKIQDACKDEPLSLCVCSRINKFLESDRDSMKKISSLLLTFSDTSIDFYVQKPATSTRAPQIVPNNKPSAVENESDEDYDNAKDDDETIYGVAAGYALQYFKQEAQYFGVLETFNSRLAVLSIKNAGSLSDKNRSVEDRISSYRAMLRNALDFARGK